MEVNEKMNVSKSLDSNLKTYCKCGRPGTYSKEFSRVVCQFCLTDLKDIKCYELAQTAKRFKKKRRED